MIILLPMGGKGERFAKSGYKTNKASILVTSRKSSEKLPMVLCALNDIPYAKDKNTKIICVDRDFHENDGTETLIKQHYPNTVFIHDHVLLDQAYGCFLAREFLQSDDELFIAACDSGMDINLDAFENAKKTNDVLMISHSNDDNIAKNPYAHSWAKLKENSNLLESLSLKTPVSNNLMQDHATTGMFWFKRASDFLTNLEEMIWNKDTLDGKYYVDKVLNYCINSNLKVSYFDVNFFCWGTPDDYENYEKTLAYWKNFVQLEEAI